MTPGYPEAIKKRIVMQNSQASYVLADSSKFHVFSNVKVCDLEGFTVISDKRDAKIGERVKNDHGLGHWGIASCPQAVAHVTKRGANVRPIPDLGTSLVRRLFGARRRLLLRRLKSRAKSSMVPRQVARPGLSLAHIGGLNAAVGAGEIALGVVAHHEDLMWLEPMTCSCSR